MQAIGTQEDRRTLTEHSGHHHFGFWVVAASFLVNMGFCSVPTPLYVLYQQRDGFSTFMVTIVFAVYALGVVVSLLIAGHVSDWVGRRRVLVPALFLNVVSAVIFIAAPQLPGLLLARLLSGISVGLTTATATAWLGELHQGTRHRAGRRADLVAIAANLGGIGVGPLVAGFLAEWAPAPLKLSYIVFGIVLFTLAVLVAVSPETIRPPEIPPTYRPQRIVVPADKRPLFFAATAAGFATFAVFGVFNSLAPGFLSGTLHQHSHAVAGTVAFAAFASAALAQMAFNRSSTATLLRWGPRILLPGLVLLTAGMWLPSLALFVVGGIACGAGGGLSFRGALVTAAGTVPAEQRGEALAGYFLGSYVGISVPVIGLGLASQEISARSAMLVFVVLVALALVISSRAVLSGGRPGRR